MLKIVLLFLVFLGLSANTSFNNKKMDSDLTEALNMLSELQSMIEALNLDKKSFSSNIAKSGSKDRIDKNSIYKWLHLLKRGDSCNCALREPEETVEVKSLLNMLGKRLKDRATILNKDKEANPFYNSLFFRPSAAAKVEHLIKSVGK